MFRGAIEAAWTLDQWLKTKVGRPYTVLLTVALVTGLSANIEAAVRELSKGGNLVAIALTVGVYAILLVNQLAQLHEYRQTIRAHREASNDRRAARRAERKAR